MLHVMHVLSIELFCFLMLLDYMVDISDYMKLCNIGKGPRVYTYQCYHC